MKMNVLQLSCVLSFFGFVHCFGSLSSLDNLHEEPPIDLDDFKSTVKVTVRERYFDQTLDHFDESSSKVWPMRYFENDRFFQQGEKEKIVITRKLKIILRWTDFHLSWWRMGNQPRLGLRWLHV
jgi:Serine carboxypeptidase S28